jgi:hypothetical protein
MSSAAACNVPAGTTPPVGLFGELMITSFVRSPSRSLSSWSAKLKFELAMEGQRHGHGARPPDRRLAVPEAGVWVDDLISGSQTARIVKNSSSFAPWATSTRSGATSIPRVVAIS